MKVKIIASGSKGNFYIIEGIKDKILIEAGININKIKKALDYDFSDIKLCLISHEHLDHSKSAIQLSEYVKIVTSKKTASEIGLIINWESVNDGSVIETEEFKISSFDTQHDCEEPLGFLIESKIERKRILFATDTYYVKYRFDNIDLFMVECNYSEDVLEHNLEEGNIPKMLRNRLSNSHFELYRMLEFLKASNAHDKLICPIHISEKNINFKLMQEEIKAIGKYIDYYKQKEIEI